MSSVEIQSRPTVRERSAAEFLERVSSNLLKLGIRGRVQRVDISRKGELTAQVAIGGQQQWLLLDPGFADDGSADSGRPGEIHQLNASNDRKIPLARQLSAVESVPGMTVLSYLPRRRLVILDSRGSQTRVLKGYRKGKGRRTADNYALAANGSIPDRFFVPAPSGYNSAHEYISMPFVNGTPFQLSADRSEDFEDLGRGIRNIQALDCPGDALAEFNRQDELEVIDERARRMRLVGCAMPTGWSELRHRIGMVASKVSAGGLAPAHRDLHDGQLIRSSRGIALLDFDLFCRAEPELDAANFLVHLALRQMQMPHRISDQCIQLSGKKFLDGLRAYERTGFWERLRLYQATSFCRLQLVYSLRPRWTAIVEPLGRLGHRCLDDLKYLAG